VDPDDGPEDEGPFFAWLPPDDRLWRHPSEGGDTAACDSSVPAPPGKRRRGLGTALLTTGTPSATTRIWGVAIVAGLVGALVASGLGMVTGEFEQQPAAIRLPSAAGSVVTLTSATTPSAGNTVATIGWSTVDDAVAPAVVAIDVTSAMGTAAGSGVLFKRSGRQAYVITDSSLVAGGGTVQVSFLSGNQYQGRVIGQDAVSGLALIAVPNVHETLPALGTVADLQLANPVLAVGARTAAGPGSVFPGLLSADDLEVNLTSGSVMQNLIAASIPSLPDSEVGGPLVDQQGQVVGITVDIAPTDGTYQAITFAVPVDEAEQVATQLLNGGQVTHPWLGVINAQDLPPAVAHQLGLAGGAMVGEVWPDSPASKLGLDPNDIITSFDGQPVTSSGTLTELLCQSDPGRRAVISYLHDDRLVQATVMVSDQPTGY